MIAGSWMVLFLFPLLFLLTVVLFSKGLLFCQGKKYSSVFFRVWVRRGVALFSNAVLSEGIAALADLAEGIRKSGLARRTAGYDRQWKHPAPDAPIK